MKTNFPMNEVDLLLKIFFSTFSQKEQDFFSNLKIIFLSFKLKTMIRLKNIIKISRQALEKFLDYLPLPLLLMGDILFFLVFIADLVGKDFLPFVEEVILGLFLLYLNHYLLVRVFGFISLRRLLRFQTLTRKQKLGMAPYEPWARKSLKLLNTLIKEWSSPLSADWLKEETEHLKRMAEALNHLCFRLEIVDQLFFSSSLNPLHLKEQIQTLERLSKINHRRSNHYHQDSLRVQAQYEKSQRLLAQRNLLVYRLEKFYQMLERVNLIISPELSQKLPRAEIQKMVWEVKKEFEELDSSLSSQAEEKPPDHPPASLS